MVNPLHVLTATLGGGAGRAGGGPPSTGGRVPPSDSEMVFPDSFEDALGCQDKFWWARVPRTGIS